METGSISSPFSKKQIALLLGIPATILVGYYIYKRQTSTSKEENKTASVEDRRSADDTASEDAEERKKRTLQAAIKYKEKGNECYRNGKYDEAIKNYDKAIESCPEDSKIDLAIFYQNRAASYEMLQRWQQVKADCTKALELNPKYPKPYTRRSKANQQLGNLYECLDDLTASCILESFQNKKSIEDVDMLLRNIAEKEAVELLKQKGTELPSRYFIKTFLDAFIMDPIKTMEVPSPQDEDTPKGFIRAKIALDAENFDEVLPALNEEIDQNESEGQYRNEALLLRATMYILMGLLDKAEADLNALIDNPEIDAKIRANAYMRRATLNVQNERKDLAFKDYDEAEKLTPNNPDIYHNRAQIYILLDQLENALADYNKALKLAPDHAMAYAQKCYAEYRLAFVAQDQRRLISVMNDFKNAIEKYPNCVECYSLMAQVLSDQGQYDEADKFFAKAIKVDPQNAALHVHRGVMHLQWRGDINKAIDIISKSIEIDDKCEFAYEMLGTIAIQRAELEKAIETFNKAIKFARTLTEMTRLCALRSAAVAQLNVTKKLGIDVSSIVGLYK